MNNKRAQVSETMTWIVATVIILIILLVSVFLASLVGQSKAFPANNKIDLFAHKSITSYLLTKDASGEIIYNEIKNDGALNDFNGNLAKNLFINLYSGYYNKDVFLGIIMNRIFNPVQANSYFTIPPGETANSPLSHSSDEGNSVIDDSIPLNEDKSVQMILWHAD